MSFSFQPGMDCGVYMDGPSKLMRFVWDGKAVTAGEFGQRIQDLKLQISAAAQSVGGAWYHLEQAYEMAEGPNGGGALRQEIKEAWKCVRAAQESLGIEKRLCACGHERDAHGGNLAAPESAACGVGGCTCAEQR